MDTFKFNNSPSNIMHVDINSCFATVEQQANPLLRGKPIVVAAYATGKGCILAASIEAKKLGIKTGMRVADGRAIYAGLKVLTPDPNKYRFVHLKLKKILEDYSPSVTPKSIDEFVLKPVASSMQQVASEIKRRIRTEIGEWITVSVGIAPNRYLAKIAAGLHKPDGLDEINKDNSLKIYAQLKLTDLTGIKKANAARLNSVGIYSVLDFYNAPIWKLKVAFRSVTALYWHTRLHGYEVDSVEFKRRSFGNSVAIGANLSKISQLSPILARLTQKMCTRLRAHCYRAGGVHLMLVFKDGSVWHKGRKQPEALSDTADFFKAAFGLLVECNPKNPVLNIAVSVFDLTKNQPLQLNMFKDVAKRAELTKSVDKINERWGDFSVFLGRSMNGSSVVKDRIAFGGVKEMEEIPLNF